MTMHFASASTRESGGISKAVANVMGNAGATGSADYWDWERLTFSFTWHGIDLTVPDGWLLYTSPQTVTAAWDDERLTLVLYNSGASAESTDKEVGGYVYVIVAQGVVWFPSRTSSSRATFSGAWNLPTLTAAAPSSTTHAMLTPLVADGKTLWPLYVSANGVLDTSGTIVSDTAGVKFTSLGNWLYVINDTNDTPGAAVTCSVGSVTSLPAGAAPTVENMGTLNDVVLSFGIPKGDKGDKGDTGATGAKGDKGDKGDPGAKGADGASASVTVGTVTELPAGSTPTVTNSGTATAAVLNFGIPAGAKGDKGDPGSGGNVANVNADGSQVVIGNGATNYAGSSAAPATALGVNAKAGANDVAIGSNADAAVNGNSTAIGISASSHATNAVALGANASVTGNSGVAIGQFATASSMDSVAIGSSSKATEQDVVSVGNESKRRRVVNVADPTSSTDAATKGYVDAHAASGGTGAKGDKGDKGDTGARGNRVYVTASETAANSTGNAWGDLTPAVSSTDPPSVGDFVLTPAGNLMPITGVATDAGTYDVGAVLAVLKGAKGDKGDTGAAGNGGGGSLDMVEFSLSGWNVTATGVKIGSGFDDGTGSVSGSPDLLCYKYGERLYAETLQFYITPTSDITLNGELCTFTYTNSGVVLDYAGQNSLDGAAIFEVFGDAETATPMQLGYVSLNFPSEDEDVHNQIRMWTSSPELKANTTYMLTFQISALIHAQ